MQAKHAHHDSFLLINNGNGFDTVQNISNSHGMSRGIWDGGWRRLIPLDINGDGKTDFFLLHGRGSAATYCPANTHLLMCSSAKLPAVLEVKPAYYNTLTDKNLYTKGTS